MDYAAELLRQVLSNLARNKLRSFLTMAGIAWGVASIVLIVAMGDGFKQGQRNNTKQLGENIVIVFPGRTEKQAGGRRAGRRIRLNYDDIRDIRAECYRVRTAIGELETQTRLASPFNSGAFTVNGVEPQYSQVRSVEAGEGRFLNEADEAEARRVCVLGVNVRKQLFGTRGTVVGTQVRINGIPFEVIGLMKDKNQNSSYSGLDVDKIYVPYSTVERDLPPNDPNFLPGIVNDIVYVPVSLEAWKPAQEQVRAVLARNHRFDAGDKGALGMWDTVENAQMVDGIFRSMTGFLGTIAVVTLTLGGVGVMNIMLVTVSERTREIGLRMALGARRRRILADFLVEGAILAFGSGALGWLGSWSLAALVNSFPMPEMFAGLPVRPSTTLLAFTALAVIAIASALLPAWRAASLTPVEALRDER